MHDDVSGETVCMDCGLVLETGEFTPPADRVPKNDPINPIVYTSGSVGTEIESFQRLEISIAKDIKWLVPILALPSNVTKNATNYVRKLRYVMKRQNPNKIRFTKTELTALSLWVTLKQMNHPLSYDEFSQKIAPHLGVVNLMKAEKRASYFVKNQTRVPDVELVTAHIHKIVAMLERERFITSLYANTLNTYAKQMIHTNQGIVTCRRAKLVASSAVLASDGLLAERLRLLSFAQWVNVGTAKLSSLAAVLKRSAPPVPPQCAAIMLREYFFQELSLNEA
ncbi:MAG: hypothetical protein LBI79_06125 [Nitrososphaerota archaeon]|nr:hypothetical protein [Nitrososphaerota archaeon]